MKGDRKAINRQEQTISDVITFVPSQSPRGIFPVSFEGFPEDSKTFENVRFKIGTDGVTVFF